MNSHEILSHFRNQLAQRIIRRDCVPDLQPLAISPWLGMSLMQKAIRRGREDLALRAAATLLVDAPDRLWRRLAIIAFEDVGHRGHRHRRASRRRSRRREADAGLARRRIGRRRFSSR